MTKLSEARPPHFGLTESAAPPTPASGEFEIYAATDGTLHTLNDAGTDTELGSGGGSGLTTDTSFPGGPSTGDRLRRSDLDYMVFFYDGTRWVSEQMFNTGHISDVLHGTVLANPTLFYVGAYADRDLWLVDMHMTTYIATTNNGSNFYTFTLNKFNAANSNTTTGASFATSADSASTWTRHTTAVDHLYAASTYIGMRVTGAETGAAGAVYWTGFVTYRIVAT